MAEYVHQTLEQMLPELEEMRTCGLFTPNETKVILKKREAFEYRLRQRTKTKQSYLNYIEYEEKLLELIKLRKIRYGIDSNNREVQHAIMERINNLHRLLTTRFSEDVNMWEKHISFCKKTGQLPYVTRLYNKMLRIHSHREDIWVKAAQFERSPEGNGNPELARELLLKGQRVLPDSETLYLEMYQMELDLATTILKRKKILKIADFEEADEKGEHAEFQLAKIIYKKSVEIFPNNPKFHLKMLNVCSKFGLAKHLLNGMKLELKGLYPNNPDTWNGLAMCELNKYKKMSEETRKYAVNRCLDIFRQGLEKASEEPTTSHSSSQSTADRMTKSPKMTESMWNYCLRGHLHVLELRRGQPDGAELLASTLDLFQKAIRDGKLSQELFVYLIKMLTDMGLQDDAALVASKGVETYSASAVLWLTHLTNMAERDVDLNEVIKTFRSATNKVTPEDSWPLWQFILHLVSVKDSSTLESIMEDACRSVTPDVCKPAKEWCLEWTFRQGGIKKARHTYKSLKCMRPISMEFYRRYILIENSQLEPNLDLMRSAFEEALAEFGQTDQGIWLNYMDMERKIGQDAPRAGQLHQRALHSLRQDLKEDFIRTNALISLTA